MDKFARSSGPEPNRLRAFILHVVLGIMTLFVDVTSGNADIILAVLSTAVWMWRSETYDAYEIATDSKQQGSKLLALVLLTTPVALAAPCALYFGSVEHVSVYRTLAFVVLLAYVLCDLGLRVLSWRDERNTEACTFFIDFVASSVFMANAVAFVSSDPD